MKRKTDDCPFRTTIGGQALIEGILMRGPKKQAVVCRTKDGLVEKTEELRLVKDRHPVLGLPFLRGVVTLFQVPIARGVEIAEAAKAKCSGQAKCFRYAMSHVTGKIEIIGPIGDEMVFRYHQAKDRRNLGRVFKMKLTPDQCWLEDIPE